MTKTFKKCIGNLKNRGPEGVWELLGETLREKMSQKLSWPILVNFCRARIDQNLAQMGQDGANLEPRWRQELPSWGQDGHLKAIWRAFFPVRASAQGSLCPVKLCFCTAPLLPRGRRNSKLVFSRAFRLLPRGRRINLAVFLRSFRSGGFKEHVFYVCCLSWHSENRVFYVCCLSWHSEKHVFYVCCLSWEPQKACILRVLPKLGASKSMCFMCVA